MHLSSWKRYICGKIINCYWNGLPCPLLIHPNFDQVLNRRIRLNLWRRIYWNWKEGDLVPTEKLHEKKSSQYAYLVRVLHIFLCQEDCYLPDYFSIWRESTDDINPSCEFVLIHVPWIQRVTIRQDINSVVNIQWLYDPPYKLSHDIFRRTCPRGWSERNDWEFNDLADHSHVCHQLYRYFCAYWYHGKTLRN